jgi:co-chaperonin GroES (HSP10)
VSQLLPTSPLDPRAIVPKRDWIMVLNDPRKKELSGGIILPEELTGIERVTEGSGEVVSIGPGKKNAALGIQVGDRAVYRSYIKYVNAFESDEFWPDGQMKRFSLISVEDVMGICPPGVSVGVFSRKSE